MYAVYYFFFHSFLPDIKCLRTFQYNSLNKRLLYWLTTLYSKKTIFAIPRVFNQAEEESSSESEVVSLVL